MARLRRTGKGRNLMRQIIMSIGLGLILAGCAMSGGSPEETAAEFGICYDARACPAGQESAFSVTKNACAAANGKSWKGGASGCVNL